MNDTAATIQVTDKVKITPKPVYSIVAPYAYEKIMEQVKAIAPITLFLLVFQFLVFRLLHRGHPLAIAVGMCCVVIGLMFFIDGLRVGVMPLGENIGATMPAKAHLWVIFVAACVLGTTANMAGQFF